MVRKSLIYANNVLILDTVHLIFVSERAGLLKQKIEPRMVTGSYSMNYLK